MLLGTKSRPSLIAKLLKRFQNGGYIKYIKIMERHVLTVYCFCKPMSSHESCIIVNFYVEHRAHI